MHVSISSRVCRENSLQWYSSVSVWGKNWNRKRSPRRLYQLPITAINFSFQQPQRVSLFSHSTSTPLQHMIYVLAAVFPHSKVDFSARISHDFHFLPFFSFLQTVPPEKPQITDTNGEQLPSVIGPYTEGDRLSLVCEVEGGKPTPAVTWWRESVLLDDSYEAISGPKNVVLVRNQLTIGALSRDHQMASFTCQASNNNQSQPLSTTVSIELYCKFFAHFFLVFINSTQ